MSHGLYATAKATDMALKQISFFILITLLIRLPFQMHFAALPTHPTAPEQLSANSGLSSENDKPLCLHLRIPQTQPRNPLARKKKNPTPTSVPPADPPRREKACSDLRALCRPEGPPRFDPARLAARPEGPCLPQRHGGAPGPRERAVPVRPASRFCPLPRRDGHSGNKAREGGSARPGSAALPARCRAPRWDRPGAGATRGRGARRCRSEGGVGCRAGRVASG